MTILNGHFFELGKCICPCGHQYKVPTCHPHKVPCAYSHPLYILNPRHFPAFYTIKTMCSFPVFHKNENTQYELVEPSCSLTQYFWNSWIFLSIRFFFYSWVVICIIWIIQAFVKFTFFFLLFDDYSSCFQFIFIMNVATKFYISMWTYVCISLE